MAKEVYMIDLKRIKNRIKKLRNNNRTRDAIGFTRKMLDKYPHEGCLYKMLGDLYLWTEDMRRALIEYERGVFVFWEQGYYPNAIVLLKKIMRMNSKYPNAYQLLSAIQTDLGQYLHAARNRARYVLYDRAHLSNADVHRHLETMKVLITKSIDQQKRDS